MAGAQGGVQGGAEEASASATQGDATQASATATSARGFTLISIQNAECIMSIVFELNKKIEIYKNEK